MNKTHCFFISILLGCFSSAFSQPVSIVYDRSSPQSKYAADMLQKALVSKGYKLNNTKAEFIITLSMNAKQLRKRPTEYVQTAKGSP